MVRVAGFELPALVLSYVKGCKTQITAKKSETFHVTSCLISICAIPLQRETEGEKTAEPAGIKAPATQSGRGPFHAFFVALKVMTAAWARVQNAPGLLPSVMPRALASWSSGARAGLTGCLPITV